MKLRPKFVRPLPLIKGLLLGNVGGASSSLPSTAESLRVCECHTCVCEVSYGAVLVLRVGGRVSFISLLFFAGCHLYVAVICYSPHVAETLYLGYRVRARGEVVFISFLFLFCVVPNWDFVLYLSCFRLGLFHRCVECYTLFAQTVAVLRPPV